MGRSHLRVKGLQVRGNRRGAEGIDDDDRLALSLDPLGEQRGLVIGPLELERLVAGDTELGLASRRGRRLRHLARREDMPDRKWDDLDRGGGRRSHRSTARRESRERCQGRADNHDQFTRTMHSSLPFAAISVSRHSGRPDRADNLTRKQPPVYSPPNDLRRRPWMRSEPPVRAGWRTGTPMRCRIRVRRIDQSEYRLCITAGHSAGDGAPNGWVSHGTWPGMGVAAPAVISGLAVLGRSPRAAGHHGYMPGEGI